MRPKFRYQLLLGSLFLTFAVLAPVWGEEPASPPGAGPAERPAASDEGLARELAALKQAVARLESKIDALTEQLTGQSFATSPEFPQVRIRLRSESGEPLAGATATLKLVDGDRPAELASISDGNGVLFDRVLPYGNYRYNIETDVGWRTSGRANAEFGKGIDLTIVAPASSEQSTVILDPRLRKPDKQALSGLRFGELRRYSFPRGSSVVSGFTPHAAPEPGESPGEYKSFPTLGDGIEQIGFSIRISASRTISQPDGEASTWHWSPDDSKRRFLITEDKLYPISESGGKPATVSGEHGYFVDLPDKNMRVAYIVVDLGEPVASPHSITIPSGETTVWVTGVHGRPTQEVLKALDAQADNDGQIWLPVELEQQSAWIPRLLNTSGWLAHVERGGLVHLLRKETTTAPSSTHEVVLLPPEE